MSKKKYQFLECVSHCGFNNLPEGIEQYFDRYEESFQKEIIDKSFLRESLLKFHTPADKIKQMENALEEIEKDEILGFFTRFLVWDLCQANKRFENNYYNNLVPTCMKTYREYYSFLVLLSCVKPSMEYLSKKGVPLTYYEKIPYTPMERQIEKWILHEDITVSDFPWDINFYTCSIFLMDRFYFIPCKLEDEISVYRNETEDQVVALYHANKEFRRDGQVNGTNEIYDKEGKFLSSWVEDAFTIRANAVNPTGYVEKEPIERKKKDWKLTLTKGDLLLAFHIPSGPGFTPERVKNSMNLALNFYKAYFSELEIKGFWSESWVYDTRLSLFLSYEKSNIAKVQRQFYLYPTKNSDAMILERVFGVKELDLSTVTGKNSLENGIINYMKTGARFNTLSMFVLKEDVNKVGECPYITDNDLEKFKKVVNYIK